MFIDIHAFIHATAWPLALLIAWFAGEALFARINLPHISTYFLIGLLLSWAGVSELSTQTPTLILTANIALNLALFELGYRINLRWFRKNPWILACGLAESVTTFLITWMATAYFDLLPETRVVIAALAISTSPAILVRVTNELRSSGHVTERTLHISALNCLASVFMLNLVVGYWHLETSGSWLQAAIKSIYVLFASSLLGAGFGLFMPWLLQKTGTTGQGSTVAFALAIALLTVLAQIAQLSPMLAALAFGILARKRRILLANNQRNFGALGDLLSVFLFMYIATFITWSTLGQYIILSFLLVIIRLLTKTFFNVFTARWSGTTFQKGLLTGLALTPISAFAILILEQSRLNGFDIADESLLTLSGMFFILEITGPVIIQQALRKAGESHRAERICPQPSGSN